MPSEQVLTSQILGLTTHSSGPPFRDKHLVLAFNKKMEYHIPSCQVFPPLNNTPWSSFQMSMVSQVSGHVMVHFIYLPLSISLRFFLTSKSDIANIIVHLNLCILSRVTGLRPCMYKTLIDVVKLPCREARLAHTPSTTPAGLFHGLPSTGRIFSTAFCATFSSCLP